MKEIKNKITITTQDKKAYHIDMFLAKDKKQQDMQLTKEECIDLRDALNKKFKM